VQTAGIDTRHHWVVYKKCLWCVWRTTGFLCLHVGLSIEEWRPVFSLSWRLWVVVVGRSERECKLPAFHMGVAPAGTGLGEVEADTPRPNSRPPVRRSCSSSGGLNPPTPWQIEHCSKVLYFPYWSEAPTTPIRPKNCMMGNVHDIMTCAKFQIRIFVGYYLQGVKFSIVILIFALALPQSSAMRCLW